MNKDKEASFDILKMFTAMMAVLTAVVVAAFVHFYTKAEKAKRDSETELKNLNSLYKLGTDEKFKELVGRYQTYKAVSSRGNLRSWVQSQNRNVVNITSTDDRGVVKGTGQEPTLERIALTIQPVLLQNLIGFLFDLQNRWPGLRIENLNLSNFVLNKGWDARVDIAVIRAKTEDEAP